MSALARIHSNAIMESIFTHPDWTYHRVFHHGWDITATHCVRKDQRSGGLNIVAARVQVIRDGPNEFLKSRFDKTVVYKNRLKKGWKSHQFHKMIASAYDALNIDSTLKSGRLIVNKETKAVYRLKEYFMNNTCYCENIASGKTLKIFRSEIEALTISPEDWYARNKMFASLKSYHIRAKRSLNT